MISIFSKLNTVYTKVDETILTPQHLPVIKKDKI